MEFYLALKRLPLSLPLTSLSLSRNPLTRLLKVSLTFSSFCGWKTLKRPAFTIRRLVFQLKCKSNVQQCTHSQKMCITLHPVCVSIRRQPNNVWNMHFDLKSRLLLFGFYLSFVIFHFWFSLPFFSFARVLHLQLQ